MVHKDIEWDKIDWPKVDAKVNALQERIYKASLKGNKYSVRYLQEILINTLEAKLLAVRRVTTENKGRKTDGTNSEALLRKQQIRTTRQQKQKLAQKLRIDGKACPISRVFIQRSEASLPKPGRNERQSLDIPIIRDRAKQALLKLALEPEWEAKFEPNSYGFRPGRSCHDAIEAVFVTIRTQYSKSGIDKWVLNADLKGCFDNINHDYLLKKLDTNPKLKSQISAWLKAGIFEGYLTTDKYEEVKTNQSGTPQGNIITPLLANIVLDGLEEHLKTWNSKLPSTTGNYMRPRDKQKQIRFIRYADDFVVIHPDRNRLEETKTEIQNWLNQTSELRLSKEKISIKSVAQGFDFLGHSFISVKRNGKARALIYPSKKSQKRLIHKLSEIFHKSKASTQVDVIKRIRPITVGWSNFFKYVECKQTFSKLDFRTYGLIRAWAYRRHHKSGRKYAMNKYFSGSPTIWKGTKYLDRWVFKCKYKLNEHTTEELFLPKLAWTKSTKFTKVKDRASPYDGNHEYWIERSSKFHFSESQVKLLKQQSWICPKCGGKVSPFADVQIDHKRGRKVKNANNQANLQLLHTHCHIRKTNSDLSFLYSGK